MPCMMLEIFDTDTDTTIDNQTMLHLHWHMGIIYDCPIKFSNIKTKVLV